MPQLKSAALTEKGDQSMPTGKVKWFNPQKGYGFLVSDDGEDVFCHYSSIQDGSRNLTEGEKISYEVGKTEKGLSAKNVQKLS